MSGMSALDAITSKFSVTKSNTDVPTIPTITTKLEGSERLLSQNKEFIDIPNEDKPGEFFTAYNHTMAQVSMPYKVKNSIHKVVVVVGESRQGKSQFIRNICFPGSIATMSAVSETPIPKNYTLMVEMEDGVCMTVEFIDTPGFNEQTEKPRPDEEIQDCILSNLKRISTKLDMILIVARQISNASMIMMEKCVTMFGDQCKDIMYILFTGFEGLGEPDEINRLSEYNSRESLKTVRDLVGDKILFSGCLTKQMVNSDDTKKMILKKATEQQVARNAKLLETIRSSPSISLAQVGAAHTSDRTAKYILKSIISVRSSTKVKMTAMQDHMRDIVQFFQLLDLLPETEDEVPVVDEMELNPNISYFTDQIGDQEVAKMIHTFEQAKLIYTKYKGCKNLSNIAYSKEINSIDERLGKLVVIEAESYATLQNIDSDLRVLQKLKAPLDLIQQKIDQNVLDAIKKKTHVSQGLSGISGSDSTKSARAKESSSITAPTAKNP